MLPYTKSLKLFLNEPFVSNWLQCIQNDKNTVTCASSTDDLNSDQIESWNEEKSAKGIRGGWG